MEDFSIVYKPTKKTGSLLILPRFLVIYVHCPLKDCMIAADDDGGRSHAWPDGL